MGSAPGAFQGKRSSCCHGPSATMMRGKADCGLCIPRGVSVRSAVFDNIPLPRSRFKTRRVTIGVLACVGFGGAMIVSFGFESRCGLVELLPRRNRSGPRWLYTAGTWTLALCGGFHSCALVMGWHPNAPHRRARAAALNADRATPPAAPMSEVVLSIGRASESEAPLISWRT